MSRLLLILVAMVSLAGWAQAQEVPLDNCRELPIVKASVNNKQFHFLLDTGASLTLLNQKSFSSIETREITMESWNGTTGAPAHEVILHDFTIGDHSLFNLKLIAVDLNSVERSCQKRDDGVLGFLEVLLRRSLPLWIVCSSTFAACRTRPRRTPWQEFE